jgi:hypothetical protein
VFSSSVFHFLDVTYSCSKPFLGATTSCDWPAPAFIHSTASLSVYQPFSRFVMKLKFLLESIWHLRQVIVTHLSFSHSFVYLLRILTRKRPIRVERNLTLSTYRARKGIGNVYRPTSAPNEFTCCLNSNCFQMDFCQKNFS